MLDQPISTKTEYRFGDDGRGNMDLLATTVCPKVDLKRPNAYIQGFIRGNYTLSEMLEDSKHSWNLTENLLYMKIDSKTNFNSLLDNNPWIPHWIPELDWLYGHCYTFYPRNHEMTRVPITAMNRLSKSQVQEWVFNVSLFLQFLFLTASRLLFC